MALRNQERTHFLPFVVKVKIFLGFGILNNRCSCRLPSKPKEGGILGSKLHSDFFERGWEVGWKSQGGFCFMPPVEVLKKCRLFSKTDCIIKKVIIGHMVIMISAEQIC